MNKAIPKDKKDAEAAGKTQVKRCACCGNAPCNCPDSHGHKK